MSKQEEGRSLLGEHPLEESDDDEVMVLSRGTVNPPPPHDSESPPPSYSDPQPATLTPTPFTEYVSAPAIPRTHVAMAAATARAEPPRAVPVPATEAPPDYFLHEPKSNPPAGKAGLAVQIQIDGKLVPGTVMEDASGRHMVYICQPQPPSSSSSSSSNGAGAGDRPPPPKDYFFLSILSLLCCCAPIGIVALIKSLEVQRLYRRGDYAGAARASRQAHSWASAAVVFGATIAIIVFALKVYFSEFDHKKHYYYY